MGLQLIRPDDDLEDPTDHPHVSEDTAPPLNGEDSDADRYSVYLKGSDPAVTFFQAVFTDNLDDDLYDFTERGEVRNLGVYGITGDDVWDVIEVFDATAEAIESVKIVGTVNGADFEIEDWDGELRDEPLFASIDN